MLNLDSFDSWYFESLYTSAPNMTKLTSMTGCAWFRPPHIKEIQIKLNKSSKLQSVWIIKILYFLNTVDIINFIVYI